MLVRKKWVMNSSKKGGEKVWLMKCRTLVWEVKPPAGQCIFRKEVFLGDVNKTLSEICCSECLIKSRFRQKTGHSHNQFWIQHITYTAVNMLNLWYIWGMQYTKYILQDVHIQCCALTWHVITIEHSKILQEKWLVMSESCQRWRASHTDCLTGSYTLWFSPASKATTYCKLW